MPVIKKPNLHFDATLYTGTGASQTVTVGFEPDFAWLKRRDGIGSNMILDKLRLTSSLPNRLFPDTTDAESTLADGQNSFSSTGIVLDGSGGGGGDVNTSGRTYVAWQWKAGGTAVTNTSGTITSQVSANPTAGFSVVTYTHNGTNSATVGHGLGVTPSFIINKQRSAAATNWRCYHVSLTAGYNIQLNLSSAQGTAADIFQTAPTSSVFTPGNGDSASGQTMVAYCFAPIAGYSAFGSYTGNGSTDGPFVYTGFRPRWVLVKVSSGTTASWILHDAARSPSNVSSIHLRPNSSSGNDTGTGEYMDILSNGFKLRGSGGNVNLNAGTYIYAAFAEAPLKYANAR
jgi:hypothetical protein